MKWFKILLLLIAGSSFSHRASALTIQAVQSDLSGSSVPELAWKDVAPQVVELVAQPAVAPRPKVVATDKVTVQAVHDGRWVAFRLTWKDTEKNEGGRLGTFSDGAALQFAVKDGDPPNIMMGEKNLPVHIVHWKAQFQTDTKEGIRRIKEYYPNMAIDMYPMEYHPEARVPKFTAEQVNTYSHGRAAGNAQSSAKPYAVDEILAEGFGTSQVREKTDARGFGEWKNGQWTVLIRRPLSGGKDGSTLTPGKNSQMALAIWQGGHGEVGSRKSVTLEWVELTWEKGK